MGEKNAAQQAIEQLEAELGTGAEGTLVKGEGEDQSTTAVVARNNSLLIGLLGKFTGMFGMNKGDGEDPGDDDPAEDGEEGGEEAEGQSGMFEDTAKKGEGDDLGITDDDIDELIKGIEEEDFTFLGEAPDDGGNPEFGIVASELRKGLSDIDGRLTQLETTLEGRFAQLDTISEALAAIAGNQAQLVPLAKGIEELRTAVGDLRPGEALDAIRAKASNTAAVARGLKRQEPEQPAGFAPVQFESATLSKGLSDGVLTHEELSHYRQTKHSRFSVNDQREREIREKLGAAQKAS